ncbi:MAG: potassium channel family protein [Marinifilaceae bacterium]
MRSVKIARSPLVNGGIFLVILTICGTVGYIIIDNYSFMDALFMTAISISTVGYGEMAPLSTGGQIFTIVLMMVTIILVGYVIGNMTTYIASGSIQERRIQKKLSRKMEKLANHIIVCGYGANGQQAADALCDQGKNVVIIDTDRTLLDVEYLKNRYILHGDATDDAVLERAGIDKALVLLCTLPADADNLGIILSARTLNPKLKIISRGTTEEDEMKLKRAGADEVLSPARITGNKMAELALAPDVMNFFDAMLLKKVEGVELIVLEMEDMDSSWLNKPLAELTDDNVTIVGVRDKNKEYHFHPLVDTQLGDIESCLVLTTPKQAEEIRQRVSKPIKLG